MAVSGHVCVAFTTEDTLTPKTTHREGRNHTPGGEEGTNTGQAGMSLTAAPTNQQHGS